MAKCVRRYINGSRTFEMVESVSHNWFYREYKMNRYTHSYSWSKWTNLGNLTNIERAKYNWVNLNGNEITSRELRFYFNNSNVYFIGVKLSEKDKNAKKLKYRLPY